jgi:hypothetical protein
MWVDINGISHDEARGQVATAPRVDGHVMNGQGFGMGEEFMNPSYLGGVAEPLRGDPGLLRPYKDDSGRRWLSIKTPQFVKNRGPHHPGRRRVPLINKRTGRQVWAPVAYPLDYLVRQGVVHNVLNASTLPLYAWRELDSTVQRATRQRLRAWSDLMRSSTRGGFNAYGKMTIEYQAMTDYGEAIQSMDAIADARADRPLFNTKSVPLPITYSQFWFSGREIAVSRGSSVPLDTTSAEQGGRKIAELVEKQTIGVETGLTYGTVTAGPGTHTGTSTVYGYTNFPYRVTKTDLTTPTGSNPEAVKQDVIEMRETMYTNGFYGPFMLYHSTGYDAFLDDDYFRSGSTAASRTLRERVGEIEGIAGIRRLDYLTSGYQMVLVQMTSDVAQAINAMDVTTVQWDSQGGLRKNFKVMAIQVPLLKAPYNGVAGIVHGTTS